MNSLPKTVLLDNQAITPGKIVCIGRNYVEHIEELDNEIPDEMVVFNKPNSAITSTLYSWQGEPLHYESEICFMVSDGTFSAVGFGLDITKRQLQNRLKVKGLPWERAKAFDGSALFSAFVTMNDDLDQGLGIELDINGEKRQSGNISLMIFKPADILRQLQEFMTLSDGDIVMTGTPKGVGVIVPGDKFSGRIMQADQALVSADWVAE